LNFLKYKKDKDAKKITELGQYQEYCFTDVNDKISISSAELFDLTGNLENTIIFDIRQKNEYDKYKIENSLLITSDTLLYAPEYIPRDKKLIIVCEYGIKNLSISNYLNKKLGITNIVSLEGGIKSWMKYFENKITTETNQKSNNI
jgi:rhodanese-related sulfurtransferase